MCHSSYKMQEGIKTLLKKTGCCVGISSVSVLPDVFPSNQIKLNFYISEAILSACALFTTKNCHKGENPFPKTQQRGRSTGKQRGITQG